MAIGRGASQFPPINSLGGRAPGGSLGGVCWMLFCGSELRGFTSSSSSGGGMGYLPMAISTSDKPKLQISDDTEYWVPCNLSGWKLQRKFNTNIVWDQKCFHLQKASVGKRSSKSSTVDNKRGVGVIRDHANVAWIYIIRRIYRW